MARNTVKLRKKLLGELWILVTSSQHRWNAGAHFSPVGDKDHSGRCEL